MNKRLRVLAEQAGFVTSHRGVGGIGWIWVSDGYPIDNQLEHFAALVRDDALEEAAKRIYDPKDTMVSMSEGCWRECCANEIRKLKDKP